MQFSRSLFAKAGAAALVLAAAGTASVAQARDHVYFSIGANLAPGVVLGASNAPYYYGPNYYAPAPVYYPPVYSVPAPVYYAPPAPVYYAPPVAIRYYWDPHARRHYYFHQGRRYWR